MLSVRPENTADHAAVRAINESAFESAVEADLIEALRQAPVDLVSLVAEVDGTVVGHIVFSPMTHAESPEVRMMGLGPMAVAPDFQRKGIGSELVRAGLSRCRDLGVKAVVVLGHPDYYPRFGFRPASIFGITCEYEVPDEVFMALELESGALSGISGRVTYHEAFNAV